MSTPNVEAIVIAALLESSELEALVGTRIASRHPADIDDAWIRVTLIGEPRVRSRGLYAVDSLLQIDCYGPVGGDAQEVAEAASRAVRDHLHALPDGVQPDGAVITSAVVNDRLRLPDDDLEPARERYVIDAVITCHAA